MVNKLESFTVYSSSNITADDLNVLTLLYNPLIKTDAFNLYMLLSSLVDRASLKSFTSKHQFLFDMTLLNNEQFYQARIKLEAMGLLTTLYNDNSYIYILKPPFTAKQFLVDGLLGTFLYAEVGATTYKQLTKLFSIPKIAKESYDNISKSFEDVFTTDIESTKLEKEEYLLGRNLNTGIKIEKYSFEYSKFLNIVKLIMDDSKKNSKKLETHLTNMAFAYGFDENSLANIYRQSIDSKGNLDYGLLNSNALDEFHFQYNKGVPKLAVKTEDPMYKVLLDSTAHTILLRYSKFKEPLPDDIEKISLIYQEFSNIDRAVLNLAILKVLAIKDGEVPVFKYFKTVINDLIKKGITDFDEAKKYYFGNVKDSELKTKDGSKASSSKVVRKNPQNPKWLNETIDNMMEGVETL